MQCYDCAVARQDSPAVAVCATCGAGVCLTHAVVGHPDDAWVLEKRDFGDEASAATVIR